MSYSDKVDSLNWSPQVRTNSGSEENTDRCTPRLATNLSLKYLSSKGDNFERLMLYF